MNTDEFILTHVDTGLVQISINRPPANALSSSLINEMMSTLSRLVQQDSPPGIVLTGAGERFFSAGGDINEVADHELAIRRMEDFHAFLCQLEHYPGPVVCAVRGYAVGAGFEIVLHADYVVASPQSHFGFPEINHGLLPAAKGMRRAVEVVGYRAARSLLSTGTLISAEHALAAGAVDEIAQSDDVLDRAVARCRSLCEKDPQLFSAIKRTLQKSSQMTDTALLDMTLGDLSGYLGNPKTADARSQFLTRNRKAQS
jgi:enoyl-CoA hydratase/carnithine racemase